MGISRIRSISLSIKLWRLVCSFILQVNGSNPTEILFHIINFFIRFILAPFRQQQTSAPYVKAKVERNKLETKKCMASIYIVIKKCQFHYYLLVSKGKGFFFCKRFWFGIYSHRIRIFWKFFFTNYFSFYTWTQSWVWMLDSTKISLQQFSF